MKNQMYVLPELAYHYNELSPFISEEQLRIHHQKHHQAYVMGANSILEKLDKARQENQELDYKAELKSLSFNVSGHILHSLFWENIAPVNKGGGKIEGEILLRIKNDFTSFERFKNEFSAVSWGVEGSGWGSLVYLPQIDKLTCLAIEKHNLLLMPDIKILLVLDVFEHAYYLDYKNERAKFIEAFWNIVNWEAVNKRLEKI